jgi:hypothetical protein
LGEETSFRVAAAAGVVIWGRKRVLGWPPLLVSVPCANGLFDVLQNKHANPAHCAAAARKKKDEKKAKWWDYEESLMV